jgi:hypothetical protein
MDQTYSWGLEISLATLDRTFLFMMMAVGYSFVPCA